MRNKFICILLYYMCSIVCVFDCSSYLVSEKTTVSPGCEGGVSYSFTESINLDAIDDLCPELVNSDEELEDSNMDMDEEIDCD